MRVPRPAARTTADVWPAGPFTGKGLGGFMRGVGRGWGGRRPGKRGPTGGRASSSGGPRMVWAGPAGRQARPGRAGRSAGDRVDGLLAIGDDLDLHFEAQWERGDLDRGAGRRRVREERRV